MCHILIIEDDALLALDIEALLSLHGATSFDFASTEAQAIDSATQRRPALMTARRAPPGGHGSRGGGQDHPRPWPDPDHLHHRHAG